MALEDFFDHTCDIYHLVQTEAGPGYGLPSSYEYGYPSEPDISGQECHFSVHSSSLTINQGDPANLMNARNKLTLPIGVDIRREDKIIDCTTGLEYTAEEPRNIREHHLFVYIKKLDRQEPL